MSSFTARLALVLGACLALAIAVPATLAVRGAQAARAERFDAELEGAARDVLAVVFEDEQGELDLETYAATPRAAGAPETVVVDTAGRLEAGDRDLSPAIRAAAAARLRANRTAPGDVGDVRLVVRAIEGQERRLGGVVAQAGRAELADGDRGDVLLAVLVGGGAWLLLTGMGTIAILRLAGPRTDAARREQDFLADAAHELRTPWAVVAARAEQGLRDPAGSDAAAHLRAIEATARRSGDTIADMLELARLDAGRALGATEPVRLDALAETVADERREAAVRDGVVLEVAPAERIVVAADVGLLGRALGNLVDNAIRHGGAGGSVSVAVTAAAGRARVEVSDRGPGVPPAQRERIFDRFHRAAGTAGGGAGLGLPLARLVARAHGGDVTLEPGDVAGARFVLELPLAGA